MKYFYIASTETLYNLFPKIPKIFIPREEDSTTPRIVFSQSIEGALNILFDGEDDESGNIPSIYRISEEVKHIIPSIEIAPLSPITEEVWVLEAVKPDYFGQVFTTTKSSSEKLITYENLDGEEETFVRFTYDFQYCGDFLEETMLGPLPGWHSLNSQVTSQQDYYLVSPLALNVLTPEIPNHTNFPYGNKETPRIVFSNSVEGAINIYFYGEDDFSGEKIQVYKLPPGISVTSPGIEDAPFMLLTQEVWVFKPVKPIYIGQALVTNGKKIEIPFEGGSYREKQEVVRWSYSFTPADVFLKKNLKSSVLSPPTKLIFHSPFKELVSLGSKASSILSFTISDLEGGVVESRLGKSGGTTLDDIIQNTCYFSTESHTHPPFRWEQIIAFDDLTPEAIRALRGEDPAEIITSAILKGDIRIACNDPSFSFEGYHYIATELDYNHAIPENRPPVKRNPKMEGTICKHLLSCFDWIHNNMTDLVQRFYDVYHYILSVPPPKEKDPNDIPEEPFPEHFL